MDFSFSSDQELIKQSPWSVGHELFRATAVAFTEFDIFLAQVKRIFRFLIGQQRHRLRLELIERIKFTGNIKTSFQRVEFLSQTDAAIQPVDLVLIRQPNVGNGEVG